MYFYVKNSHLEQVPAIKEYVNLFMSEKMIGKDGILTEIGLIPLTDKVRDEARKKAMGFQTITATDLKH
jgi:phosphate transport system substrate-binding protein